MIKSKWNVMDVVKCTLHWIGLVWFARDYISQSHSPSFVQDVNGGIIFSILWKYYSNLHLSGFFYTDISHCTYYIFKLVVIKLIFIWFNRVYNWDESLSVLIISFLKLVVFKLLFVWFENVYNWDELKDQRLET